MPVDMLCVVLCTVCGYLLVGLWISIVGGCYLAVRAYSAHLEGNASHAPNR